MAFAIPKIEYGNAIPTTVNFTYPPKDEGDNYNTSESTTVTLSGVSQTVVNYIDCTRKLTFGALTEAQLTTLKTFFANWAGLGKVFKYFDDSNSISYTLYELKDLKFAPVRTSSAGVDVYLYQLQMVLRRALGVVVPEGFVEVSLLNNQATPLSITGEVLDYLTYKSAKIFYEIYRKTDSGERIFNGYLTAVYVSNTATWEVSDKGVSEGEDGAGGFTGHGVTFSVTAAGQLKYISDNMAGANYEGTLKLKNFTVTG
jgi:hypothetical protein